MLGLKTSIPSRGDTILPELLTKLAIQGKVELLLASLDRDTGLEKHAVQQARLFFTGME